MTTDLIALREAIKAREFFKTPAGATTELLRRLHVGGVAFECCAGDGAIAAVLAKDNRLTEILTNDLDRTLPQTYHSDATDPRFWVGLGAGRDRPRWVISNPPFSKAHLIVPPALATIGRVAMLLRITWLEPCDGREAFLARYPPWQLIVLPRISFTGDGRTDAATCAWFIWDRFATQPCRHPIIVVPEQNPTLRLPGLELDDELMSAQGLDGI